MRRSNRSAGGSLPGDARPDLRTRSDAPVALAPPTSQGAKVEPTSASLPTAAQPSAIAAATPSSPPSGPVANHFTRPDTAARPERAIVAVTTRLLPEDRTSPRKAIVPGSSMFGSPVLEGRTSPQVVGPLEPQAAGTVPAGTPGKSTAHPQARAATSQQPGTSVEPPTSTRRVPTFATQTSTAAIDGRVPITQTSGAGEGAGLRAHASATTRGVTQTIASSTRGHGPNAPVPSRRETITAGTPWEAGNERARRVLLDPLRTGSTDLDSQRAPEIE